MNSHDKYREWYEDYLDVCELYGVQPLSINDDWQMHKDHLVDGDMTEPKEVEID